MAHIKGFNHWMLGEATVEPPVEVVNTDFVTWEPTRDQDGMYPFQAFHYSVMHPRKSEDVGGETPYTSIQAHNDSLLWMHGFADLASRVNVIDAAGQPYGPISLEEADTLDYAALGLRINTARLRETASRYYEIIGNLSVQWQGEPPVLPLPLEDRYLFPDGLDASQ